MEVFYPIFLINNLIQFFIKIIHRRCYTMEEKILNILISIQKDVKELKENQKEMQSQMKGMQGEMQSMQGTIQGMQGDIHELKEGQRIIKNNVAKILEQQNKMNENLKKHKKKQT